MASWQPRPEEEVPLLYLNGTPTSTADIDKPAINYKRLVIDTSYRKLKEF